MNEVFPSDMAFYYEEVATSRVVQIILRGMGNLAPLCYKRIAMGNKGHHITMKGTSYSCFGISQKIVSGAWMMSYLLYDVIQSIFCLR